MQIKGKGSEKSEIGLLKKFKLLLRRKSSEDCGKEWIESVSEEKEMKIRKSTWWSTTDEIIQSTLKKKK